MNDETIWSVTPIPLSRLGNFIHIWRIELDQPVETIDRLSQILPTNEIERADRFHFERDRRRYSVAHAALRKITARYLQVDSQQILFRYNKRGKPYLAGPFEDKLYFNLSHSGELALVVISCQAQTGIDLEYIRPLDDLTSLARQCFSEHENQQIHTLPASQRLTTFFNTWTRKEAFIKALGDGLSYPLDQFEVSLLPGEPTRLVHIAGSKSEARNWTLQEVRPAPGYAGAYAVRQTGVNTQFRQWVWDED